MSRRIEKVQKVYRNDRESEQSVSAHHPVRTVPDVERRARLGVRHRLAAAPATTSGPGGSAESATSSGAVAASARAVVGLHATEPVSVYLSAWARSGAAQADVDHALYRDRSIVKQLAMRRTLFAFPVDLLPAVRGSAAARVAAQQHGLLARSVVTAGLATDGDAWVERACEQALERLAQEAATTSQLRDQLPILSARLPRPENPASPPAPVAARVLTVLAASGRVVRGNNQASWTSSKPVWTLIDDWVPGPSGLTEPWGAVEGYAELVRRWLWAYGPGTEADLVWWLGATKTAVRQALADTRAVAVALEDGTPAWLHPDDVDPITPPAAWAALLPALDPATMGWRGRTFHVDPATARFLYDRAGNGLPTAWWNGRIIGGWSQRADGRVTVVPHVDLPRTAITALHHQAEQLAHRLDCHLLRTTFHRPHQEGGRRAERLS